MPLHRFLALVVLLASGTQAIAAELGSPGEPMSLEVHGFVSQGFILTTDNNYLANSDRGTFEFTEVGINFTMPLTDKLRLGMQLFARDLGPLGNYSAKLDWYYLDYHWRDWFGLRAGRVKIPFGLYNDTSDIDSARVPILLPQSVYPIANRDFLLAQTGLELYGYLNLRSAGALDYRAYVGTIFLDLPSQRGVPIVVQELTIPYVVGGRLLWETPLEGLRLGGSLQALRLDTKLLFMMNPTPISVEIPAILWVGSLEYAHRSLLLAIEYSRWHVDANSANQMFFPSSSTVAERAYGMAAFGLSPSVQASLYYSLLYPNVDKRSGRANYQHDIALAFRFDLNAYWLLKLEGHYMHGTAGLSPTLNDAKPLATLEPDWVVFLVKTTAYF